MDDVNLVGETGLSIDAVDTNSTLLSFEKDGSKSHFDLKDGKWQFWGDLPVEESAKLFWEEVANKMHRKCLNCQK